MSGFNHKYKVSNNYTKACKDKNKIRVYNYKDGTYAFINGIKTKVWPNQVLNGKILVNKGEFHHSKNKYGYNEVMFWELVDEVK